MATDTKTALLDVAEHATRARGFDGFSYADLASAVGIRKASIHYHFPTKADLSVALMDRYHKGLESEFRRIEARYTTGNERLQALLRFYRNALNNGKTLCLCIALITSRESLSEEVIQQIRSFRRLIVGWIQAVFELGQCDKTIPGVIDPASEARATLALLEGAHLTARAAEDVTIFDDATAFLKSRLAPQG